MKMGDAWEYAEHTRSPFFWIVLIIVVVIWLSLGAILFSQLYANLLAWIFRLNVFIASDGFYGVMLDGGVIVEWECTFVWFMILFLLFALIKKGWIYIIIGEVIIFGLNLLRMSLTVFLGLEDISIIGAVDNVFTFTYIILMSLVFAFMLLHAILKR